MNQFDIRKLKKCGEDVWISPHAEITRPHLVSIGNHIAIDSGFYMTTGGELGDYIHIAAQVAVIGGEKAFLKMGHFTNIAVGGRIICGSDKFLGEGLITAPGIPDQFRDNLKLDPVVFENFANLGANVVIFPGIRLGEGSVVGAFSLVTRDTEPWTIYAGIPARPVGTRKREKMLKYAAELGF